MNIFNSLFQFRPQERTTSHENFLTEALAYILQSSRPAARAWISLLTAGAIDPKQMIITTRALAREEENETAIFPDITAEGTDRDGRRFRLIVEHKWGAAYSRRQLERYKRLVAGHSRHYLAFVCAKLGDREKARGDGYNAYTWEDLYSSLVKAEPKSEMFSEFLEFMTVEGLSPGKPFSASELKAAVRDAEVRKHRGSPLRRQMRRCCEKLSNEYDWSFVPSRYRNNREVDDRWGRCQVVFSDEDGWHPGICLGFYYSTTDHRIKFTDYTKGIDLAIRIQASPGNNQKPSRVLELLREREEPLRRLGAAVHSKGQPSNPNPHTLFFVQKSLIDVIGNFNDERSQLDAIHAELKRWCEVLFEDGRRLVNAFATLNPYPERE